MDTLDVGALGFIKQTQMDIKRQTGPYTIM